MRSMKRRSGFELPIFLDPQVTHPLSRGNSPQAQADLPSRQPGSTLFDHHYVGCSPGLGGSRIIRGCARLRAPYGFDLGRDSPSFALIQHCKDNGGSKGFTTTSTIKVRPQLPPFVFQHVWWGHLPVSPKRRGFGRFRSPLCFHRDGFKAMDSFYLKSMKMVESTWAHPSMPHTPPCCTHGATPQVIRNHLSWISASSSLQWCGALPSQSTHSKDSPEEPTEAYKGRNVPIAFKDALR